MTRLAPVPTDFVLDDLTSSLLDRLGRAARRRGRGPALGPLRAAVAAASTSASGCVLGEHGLGIGFDSDELTQVLGYGALVLILAEGGLTTRWSSIRRVRGPGRGALDGRGVRLGRRGRRRGPLRPQPGLDGGAAHRRDPLLDRRRGGVLRAADRAAAPPAERDARGGVRVQRRARGHPRRRARGRVGPTAEHHPWWYVLLEAVRRAGRRDGDRAGSSAGPERGSCDALRAPRRRCSPSGSSAWSSSRMRSPPPSHTSGFIAAYLAALVLGNLGLPHRAAVRGFSPALGWIAQIGLFVLLGLLASPDRAARADRPCASSSGWSCCSSPGRCRCWSR